MTSDEHLRFIQARRREADLSEAMAAAPNDDELWSAWLLAAAAVDVLVAKMDLSDDDVHEFDRQIQALRSSRPHR
jgi:hypothetical protein